MLTQNYTFPNLSESFITETCALNAPSESDIDKAINDFYTENLEYLRAKFAYYYLNAARLNTSSNEIQCHRYLVFKKYHFEPYDTKIPAIEETAEEFRVEMDKNADDMPLCPMRGNLVEIDNSKNPIVNYYKIFSKADSSVSPPFPPLLFMQIPSSPALTLHL